MYSQSTKNYGCKNGSSFWFLLPIVFFILFITPRMGKMPIWFTIFIIIMFFKIFKFRSFGQRRNYRSYGYQSLTNKEKIDTQIIQEQQDWEVPVKFDKITETKIPEPITVDKTLQFCVECGVKLPISSKFCLNCGISQ